MRRLNEVYVLFKTGVLFDFLSGVRQKSYKSVWLVRQDSRVLIQTDDAKYTLKPYRVCHSKLIPTGKHPEVDVIDLCNKYVRKLTGSGAQNPPDRGSRVEIVLNYDTGDYCMIRMDGYSERASPWDAIL